MKILIYAPNYLPATRYGGPVNSVHGLARALVGRGHEVHVYTSDMDGPGRLDVPLDTPVEIDGVHVRYFPITAPKRLYVSPAMTARAKAEMARFDAVYLNGVFLWPGPAIGRVARAHGKPVILAPRGMLIPEMVAGKSAFIKKLWIALQEKANLAGASAIHATSNEEADGLRRMGLDLAPLAIIPNGVAAPEQMPGEEEIEAVWGDIPKGKRVAFLARLAWQKGVDVAIDTVAAAGNGAQILLAGHDEAGLRDGLEPRLEKNGQRFGRFIGEVRGARKWAFLAGADVMLAPSVKESFGMSVAEAMALGTPVICSDGVAAGEITARIDKALVVKREVPALAGALSALLADEARRARFGEQAKAIMAADYTWPAIAARMEEVMESFAATPSATKAIS